jgi:outer membrane protein assembly factor BamE (lipoprotein component of BamABCDE complex)
MHARILAALLAGCAVAGAASADTVVVNDQVQVRESQVARPPRGITMEEVQKRFGEPVKRYATVGAPPITRWDYKDFAVVFEKNLVIDAPVLGS